MNTLSSILKKDKTTLDEFIQEQNHENARAIFNLINEYTAYYEDSIKFQLRKNDFSRTTGNRIRYKNLSGFMKIMYTYLLSAGLRAEDEKRNGFVSRKEIETIFNNNLIIKAGFNEEKRKAKNWLRQKFTRIPDYIIRINKKYYKIIKKIDYEVISND